jgi:putative Holliday junction resolvase
MAVERDVEGLVVGRPMHLDGRPSKMALRAQRFGTRLAAACKLPIHFIDEALTSVEASREHRSESGRGGGIDATSACILLQDYLDQESRT